ncbi:unnamed protein product [Pseudo-nitzschia multistriata]|uniref:Uncharacterized protein n=1 Tax=Pseudo-nitzschia multistriata TaxID=183589 RepID=A0A448ZQ91_9STRA|nr:unnamed protein product [Pseudo-nitzschia multistriata]
MGEASAAVPSSFSVSFSVAPRHRIHGACRWLRPLCVAYTLSSLIGSPGAKAGTAAGTTTATASSAASSPPARGLPQRFSHRAWRPLATNQAMHPVTTNHMAERTKETTA